MAPAPAPTAAPFPPLIREPKRVPSNVYPARLKRSAECRLSVVRRPRPFISGESRRASTAAVAPVVRFIRSSFTRRAPDLPKDPRSEEHTSELQSLAYLVCRLLLEKKKKKTREKKDTH